jgi:hypothetical protein
MLALSGSLLGKMVDLLKSSQNKKGQKIFKVHSFRCLFLLEFFFGPSYFEVALVVARSHRTGISYVVVVVI